MIIQTWHKERGRKKIKKQKGKEIKEKDGQLECMPCPTVFTSSSKWNFNLCFLLVLGSCPRFYPQPSKSSHLAIRNDTNPFAPLLLKRSTALGTYKTWYKPANLFSVLYPDDTSDCCSFLQHFCISTSKSETSQHMTLTGFSICLQLLFLSLQSCPLPFSWKCSFHLSTLSHIKVTDYYLWILIWLLLEKP